MEPKPSIPTQKEEYEAADEQVTLGTIHEPFASVTEPAGPVTAYGAVAEGTVLAIVGSWDVLEIAVRNGDAAKLVAAGPGTPVSVVCGET